MQRAAQRLDARAAWSAAAPAPSSGIGLRQQLGQRAEIAAGATARRQRHLVGGEPLGASEPRLEPAGAPQLGDAPAGWRCAAPSVSPSPSSPVAACHSAMRSSAHGTGTRQLGSVSPSRSKLPSGPAAISQGPRQPGRSGSRRRSPGAISAHSTGMQSASISHGVKPARRIAVEEGRARALRGGDLHRHRARLAWMTAAHHQRAAAARAPARARPPPRAGSAAASAAPTCRRARRAA